MKTFKQFLIEYVTNPLIKLRDYLNTEKDKSEKEIYLQLAEDYWNYRKIYNGKEVEDSYEDLIQYYILNEDNISDYIADDRYDEIMRELDHKYIKKNLLNFNEAPEELKLAFGAWVYDLVTNKEHHDNLKLSGTIHRIGNLIKGDDQPAWCWMNFERYIKNSWNIHFVGIGGGGWDSDEHNETVKNIAKNGFKYGTNLEKMKGVWISGWKDLEEKELLPEGGYIFGYPLDDFSESTIIEQKYNSFVLFQSSGLEVFHRADNEKQSIFFSSTIKNIIPVFIDNPEEFPDEEQYYICDKNDPKKKYWKPRYRGLSQQEQIENLKEWLNKSFDQYKNRIVWRMRND